MLSIHLAAIMLVLSAFIGTVIVQFNRDREVAQYLLAIFFGISSITHLLNLFSLVFTESLTPATLLTLRIAGLLIAYTLGPIIYLYTRQLTERGVVSGKAYTTNLFAGATIALLFSLPLLLREYGALGAEPHDINFLALTLSYAAIPGILVAVVAIVPFTYFYLYRSWRIILINLESVMAFFSNIENKNLSWLRYLILLLAAQMTLATIEVFDAVFFNAGVLPSELADVVEVVFLFAIGLLAFSHLLAKAPKEEFLVGEAAPGQSRRYERSSMDTSQADRIAARLNEAMAKHQLYKDPFLNLSNLSNHTGINSHRISQVLNTYMNTSFFEFINYWRIEEAKTLLRNSDETVLKISEHVGFNSRSTFNAAFKKVTGQSPSIYRSSGSFESNVSYSSPTS